MPRTFLLSLLLAGLAAGLAADADAQRRRDRDDDRVFRLDTTLTLSRGGLVELEGATGEMIVNGWDRDEVRIRAVSEDSDIHLDATSSHIQVRGVGMGWAEVNYEVSVPRGTRLLLNGRNTDVTVRGTRGNVEIQAQNGDVELVDVGNVDLSAVNGDVVMQGVDAVRMNLVAGDVRIEAGRGSLQVTSVSGDIEIHNATSNRVAAQTTSGDVFYDGRIDAGGRYELSTHSGDVTVRVPDDVSAAVSLQTYSGEIESDFPITLEGGVTIGGQPRTIDFRIGSGGARITMNSFSGSVSLQRASSQNR